MESIWQVKWLYKCRCAICVDLLNIYFSVTGFDTYKFRLFGFYVAFEHLRSYCDGASL